MGNWLKRSSAIFHYTIRKWSFLILFGWGFVILYQWFGHIVDSVQVFYLVRPVRQTNPWVIQDKSWCTWLYRIQVFRNVLLWFYVLMIVPYGVKYKSKRKKKSTFTYSQGSSTYLVLFFSYPSPIDFQSLPLRYLKCKTWKVSKKLKMFLDNKSVCIFTFSPVPSSMWSVE